MASVKIDTEAVKVIETILNHGGDVKIKRLKGGVVISEEKQTIKYRPN